MSQDAQRNSAPRINFREVMPHHIEAVLVQSDNGLKTVKQTARYLEKVASCIDNGADAVKETKNLKAKYAKVPLRDEMAHFVTACAAAEEVMLHTWNTQQAFKHAVTNSIVKPFLEFYESRQKKRRDMEKDMAKMTAALNAAVSDLNKERIQCQKAWDELRVAKESKEAEEIQETRGKDMYPKLLSKWKSAKDNAIKRFNTFQNHLVKTNQMQANIHLKEIPTRLAVLEQFESDRLKLIADCMSKFQVLFATTVVELKQSSDLLAKVVPSLDPTKELAFLIDKWSSYYGPPPQPLFVDHRADLPCTADDLANDIMNSGAGRGGAPPQQTQTRAPAPAPAPAGPRDPFPPQGQPPPGTLPASNYVVSPTGQIVVPFPPNTPPPAHVLAQSGNSAPKDAPPLMSQSQSYTKAPPQQPINSQPPPASVSRAAETRASIFKQDASFFTQQQAAAPPTETQTEDVKASEVAVALGTARATYDFGLANDPANEIQYLHFKVGDLITVYDQGDEWWFGQVGDDAGFFPSNHVMMIT